MARMIISRVKSTAVVSALKPYRRSRGFLQNNRKCRFANIPKPSKIHSPRAGLLFPSCDRANFSATPRIEYVLHSRPTKVAAITVRGKYIRRPCSWHAILFQGRKTNVEAVAVVVHPNIKARKGACCANLKRGCSRYLSNKTS